MNKNILLISLLAIILTGCGKSLQISTKDFSGNCKIIEIQTQEVDKMSPDDRDRAIFESHGIKVAKVLIVETIDVDTSEIHLITPYGGVDYFTNKDIDAAQKDQVYYVDIHYYDINPGVASISIFELSKSYGIPLSKKSYSGKAEVIDIYANPDDDDKDINIAVLKTLDTEKPYIYYLPFYKSGEMQILNKSRQVGSIETGKSYYMEVTFDAPFFSPRDRCPEIIKFSPL